MRGAPAASWPRGSLGRGWLLFRRRLGLDGRRGRLLLADSRRRRRAVLDDALLGICVALPAFGGELLRLMLYDYRASRGLGSHRRCHYDGQHEYRSSFHTYLQREALLHRLHRQQRRSSAGCLPLFLPLQDRLERRSYAVQDEDKGAQHAHDAQAQCFRNGDAGAGAAIPVDLDLRIFHVAVH